MLATFAEALPAARVLFERDIHAYWYPHRAALRAAVAEGGVPLWNPWVGFGAPFLADASSRSWPTRRPGCCCRCRCRCSSSWSRSATACSPRLGAAALARRLTGGWLPALVAGGGYALAGPVLSAASLYHHFAGAAFMPWVLWALEGLLRRRDRRSALVLGRLVGGAGARRARATWC